MELLVYVVVAGLAALFSVNSKLLSNASFAALFFFIYTLHTISVRLSGFDSDIIIYAEMMKATGVNIYYLREPVVWFGHRFLYNVLGSELAVFIISDLVAGLLLFLSFRRLGMPQYSYFAFISFFPFVLGFQNVYRQLFAALCLLYALSFREDRSQRAWVAFGLAVLSHNVAALFFPMFLRLRPSAMMRFASWVALALTPAALVAGAATKSSANTGANLGSAYLILIFLFLAVFAATSGGLIRRSERLEYVLIVLVLGICAGAVAILSPVGSERVAMCGLMAIYPFLVLRIEARVRRPALIRSSLATLGFVPLLIFGTRTFVL